MEHFAAPPNPSQKLGRLPPEPPRTQVVSARLTGLSLLGIGALTGFVFQKSLASEQLIILLTVTTLLAVVYFVLPRVKIANTGRVGIDVGLIAVTTVALGFLPDRLSAILLLLLLLVIVMADLAVYSVFEIAAVTTGALVAMAIHNWLALGGPSSLAMTLFEVLMITLFVAEGRRYAINQLDQDTQRKRIEEYIDKLLTVNKQLSKVEHEKNEFISFASHQLKTPLAAIKWAFRYLLDGDAGPLSREQHSIITQGYRANEKMLRFVDELLGVVRMAQSPRGNTETPIRVQDILDEIHRFLEESTKERNQTLEWHGETTVHEMLIAINRLAFRHAVLNVADNATIYTPNGGHITVSANRKNGSFVFTISDTGIGIPKEDQSQLFERFFRASNATSQENVGSGLGLYLTKRIIDGYGGSVTIESEENVGTTVSITLPIAT